MTGAEGGRTQLLLEGSLRLEQKATPLLIQFGSLLLKKFCAKTAQYTFEVFNRIAGTMLVHYLFDII